MQQCAGDHGIKKYSCNRSNWAATHRSGSLFDDADIEMAVRGSIGSKYRNAVHTCVCANRILVQDGVYDAFTKRLAETAGAMKVADGFEPGAVIGPLIDMKAVEKVEAHIADAVKKGAKVVTGGKRAARSTVKAGRQLLRADGADRCDDRHGHHQGGDLRPGRALRALQESGIGRLGPLV